MLKRLCSINGNIIIISYSFYRRDLLIDVREFSLEATFQDPCQSFILLEVSKNLYLCNFIYCVASSIINSIGF